MRFISPNPGYKIPGKKQDYELLASGQFREISPQYLCEFRPGDLTDWEIDLALDTFKFRGVPEYEGGKGIPPRQLVLMRVSSFDTATIDNPDLRKVVEEKLLATQGIDNHLLAERPKVAAPWPAYDKVHPSKIAAKVAEDGYDPKAVIAYERDNKNRQSVIEALEALVTEAPAEELVEA